VGLQEGDECDLVVAALARDQATIVDTTEAVFHVPSRLRTEDGVNTYTTEIQKAEDRARLLGWAVETYREVIDGGWEGRLKSAGPKKGELRAKLKLTALTHYWTAVEKDLGLLMSHIEAIGTDRAIPTQEAWRKMLFASACRAFETACSQGTPREMKAYALGWRRLFQKPKTDGTITPGEEEVA
jgi:CRISPR system Cascade subunit CasA